MSSSDEVTALYHRLLGRWNERDGAGYGGLFTDDGSMVGFDGSCIESGASVAEHLGAIFEDHVPATYVAKVRDVRELGPGVVSLRGVAGIVPPGGDDLVPERNVVQGLVAVETPEGWRVAHFANTQARFDGRPEEAEALTAELRAVKAGEAGS